MVVRENYRIREDGVQLVRFYSDLGFRIMCNETGEVYDEVINTFDTLFTFSETDEPIEEEEEEEDVLNG